MRFVATSADIALVKDAIKLYGMTNQIYKMQEETAELNVELARGLACGSPDVEKISDEIADVYISLHSLAYGFCINEKIDQRVDVKMNRLALLVSRGVLIAETRTQFR